MKNLQLISSILLCFHFALFSQQPIGLTKNAKQINEGVWTISSDGVFDGSTGGSIFIDNYPYVGISKNQSYWVGGSIILDKGGNYAEKYTTLSWIVCGDTLTRKVHRPPNTDTSLASEHSKFFQIFHSDEGGLYRGGNYTKILFYRFYNDDNGVEKKMQVEGSAIPANHLQVGYEIRFVMAYIKPVLNLKYIYTADSSYGTFIYYQIYNDSDSLIFKEDCYDPQYRSLNYEWHNRIYIGSDSHGNLQDWEPSVHNYITNINSGETECGQWPLAMDPLLGKINRIIFVQGELSDANKDNFLEYPQTFSPSSGLKLDFPRILDSGYSMVIPNSHWVEFDGADSGTITSADLYNVPNVDSRLGLRTEYTGSNPIEYGIKYNLTERAEESERQRFGTASFWIGNDSIPYSDSRYNFHFYALVVLDSNNDPQKEIYVQASFLIPEDHYDEPYLKLHLDPFNNAYPYYNNYVINIREKIKEFRSEIGCGELKEIKQIIFRGDFDLAGVVLSGIDTQLVGVHQNIPFEFSLFQNYPNPFNSITKIKYEIPVRNFVILKVYDVLGNEISSVVNEEKSAGDYVIEFNGADLPSGIYFYRLRAGQYVETRKMVLLR